MNDVKSTIGWADKTWNVISGCGSERISEGCLNCYARRLAEGRLRGRCGYDAKEPFKVTFHPNRLDEPLHYRKPQRIFVCSMGDLFHQDVRFSLLCDVWRIMVNTPWHTFLVLSKRPALMKSLIGNDQAPVPPHIWLGITAENQARADERIPILLSIPAAKHFVSVEPMLGPIIIKVEWLYQGCRPTMDLTEKAGVLDWVIAGLETGPKARLCKPEWFDHLYRQCNSTGIKFWDKRNKNYIMRERP